LTNAVTITDTTFFASGSNYTIHVDTLVVDNVTVTANSIQFHNVTSQGTNFTNANASTTAVASFFGLDLSFTIFNVNTSTNLFTSSAGNQDFNASFTSGQVIRTIIFITPQTTAEPLCNDITEGVALFFAVMPTVFSILGIVLVLLAIGGLILVIQDPTRMPDFKIDFKDFNFISMFIIIFVVALIGVAVFVALAGICTII